MLKRFKSSQKFFVFILVSFLALFIFTSFKAMIITPFNEFDEAHRAENVKQMKNYGSFFVPLTGSPQDRIGELRIPFKGNPSFFIYYHIERPAFIYDLMILSTSLFGTAEWVYRLPSFLFGMGTILLFFLFAKENFKNKEALVIALICLFTAGDLWQSAQYAQLDTGLTFFMTLSFFTILKYCSEKTRKWLIIAGLSFGFAILSKGQPAVVFLIPLFILTLIKKLNIRDLLVFSFSTAVIITPWVGYLVYKFGPIQPLKIFIGFGLSSSQSFDIFRHTPIFWYVRWWWETFRPGWTIFLSLLIYDLMKRNITWQKLMTFLFVILSLIFYSLQSNKLWWYMLPLIPIACYFIYLSASDYLEDKNNLYNLSAIVFLGSLLSFTKTTSTLILIYGFFITFLSVVILNKGIVINVRLAKEKFLIAVVFLSLVLFYYRFPQIIPYDYNIKPLAQIFAGFTGQKCLYILDIPAESVLFYSNAGEVQLLTYDSRLNPECQNYLLTSRRVTGQELIKRQGDLRLFKLKGEYVR